LKIFVIKHSAKTIFYYFHIAFIVFIYLGCHHACRV